jgi:predicted O-methyltransferase YrrM
MKRILSAVRRRFSPPQPFDRKEEVARLLQPLPEPFRGRLLSMYQGDPQAGTGGHLHALDTITRISPAASTWLYQFCLKQRAPDTLEVGMAYGFSTIACLAALAQNNGLSHTAIDPYQEETWAGIGLAHALALDAPRFRFMNELSSAALVRLASEQRHFGVIFIDGGHLFDTALLDFTLSAELCRVGGHIILDDLWMPSIRRVSAFIRTNRSDFAALPVPVANTGVYRRIGSDKRDWRHFVDFR